MAIHGHQKVNVLYRNILTLEAMAVTDYSKDGNVTLGELIPFLSEQVRRKTRNAQSPTIAGKFDPAITIGR